MNRIIVRLEDKNHWERRTPITPEDAAKLRAEGVDVLIQNSPVRVFVDQDYAAKSVPLTDSLEGARMVIAVKEVPISMIADNTAYLFFSHTIKGQPYNMPLLSRIMEAGSTLFDHETITDDQGRRLVFFGRHAGYAGALETLIALGQRLEAKGSSNPFSVMKPPHEYRDLEHALEDVRFAGEQIAKEGVPEAIHPLTIPLLGHGNVSIGVQKVLKELPIEWVDADALAKLDASAPRDRVYAAICPPEAMVTPVEEGAAFDLNEFFTHPERYRSIVDQILPNAVVLFNTIYWEPRFPVYVPNTLLKTLSAEDNLRLEVIGDITCDISGSIKATYRSTSPSEPSYTYQPASDVWTDGVQSEGVAVMAVDNLPCELPRDSSIHFSASLSPFIPNLGEANLDAPDIADSNLSPEMVRSCIVWRGALTERFSYLAKSLSDAKKSQ